MISNGNKFIRFFIPTKYFYLFLRVFTISPKPHGARILGKNQKSDFDKKHLVELPNPCQQYVSRCRCQILASSGFERNIQLSGENKD
jgi:hypothetical protein